MGDESTKATNKNTAGKQNSTKDVTQTPKHDLLTEEHDKTVSKEVLLQRCISARMRACAEKGKEDKEQKAVNFAEESPDTGGTQQE